MPNNKEQIRTEYHKNDRWPIQRHCVDCGKFTKALLCADCKCQRSHEAEKKAMYIHYCGFDPEEQENADG